ncbi:MAG: FecR domain-containing protein [Candidatus Eremiobacteraeota bacterium]|nr:FecR domain-containing protein [Candidatus Eremiobacteraeota bacterium]MBV9645998.1 FecR domain-containing protein [Candidatus Eremiobacteraeota bacterium]
MARPNSLQRRVGTAALLACGCSALSLVRFAAVSAEPPLATLSAVHRGATLETASTSSKGGTVGAEISPGTVVATDTGQTAKVTIADGSSIEIEQRSRVTFEQFGRGIGGVHVKLANGTIRLDVPEKPHFAPRGFTVLTAQARVVFREKKGYVTSSSDQDVVTCLRCRIYDRQRCEQNDFIVRDASTCLSLSDAAVAVVTRQHGIQLQSSSAEAMVRSVIGQLGGSVSAASGTPWWKNPDGAEGLSVDRNAVALDHPGDTADLTVEDHNDGGNVWWLSVDPQVAAVDFVDPKGSCRLRAAGSGRTAVIAFDQLGRYVAVDVEVRGTAQR